MSCHTNGLKIYQPVPIGACRADTMYGPSYAVSIADSPSLLHSELAAQSQARDFWTQFNPGEQYFFWGNPLALHNMKAEHSPGTAWYSPGVHVSGIRNVVVVVAVVVVKVVVGVVIIGVGVDEIESLVSRPSGTTYNKNVNYLHFNIFRKILKFICKVNEFPFYCISIARLFQSSFQFC